LTGAGRMGSVSVEGKRHGSGGATCWGLGRRQPECGVPSSAYRARMESGGLLSDLASVESNGRRAFGERGEEDALAFLEDLGLMLIARNQRTRTGELDLIVSDGHVLVFVEVKARHIRRGRGGFMDEMGWPSARQRLKQRGAARIWLADPTRVRPRTEAVRFDAIRLLFDKEGRMVDVEHLQGI
jgi:putative endonuclease